MVLELLRDAPGYKFSSNPKAIAFAINESDVSMVERVVRNYGLFDFTDDGLMWSEWLMSTMGQYDEQKKKLKEAGRRGAMKRWHGPSLDDGQAIATPSLDDGQAIAQDPIPYNVTQQDFTLPDLSNGEKVSSELVEILGKTQPSGHAPGYVAQVCLQYGMTEASCNFICEHTDNASVTHPLYKRFVALVARIQREKWVPKHPDGFFIKKIFA